MLGLPVIGKEAIPADGELDQDIVFAALQGFVTSEPPQRPQAGLPADALDSATRRRPRPTCRLRTPVLCPGCRHRSVFTALKKQKIAAMGRHRCYMLGADPPLNAPTVRSAWRQHRHHGRIQRGAGAQSVCRRHRRLDLLPLRHDGGSSVLPTMAPRSRPDPRQPHHGHDRPPGQSRYWGSARQEPRPGDRPAVALRRHRRALRHGRRQGLPGLEAAIKTEVKASGLGVIVAQARARF